MKMIDSHANETQTLVEQPNDSLRDRYELADLPEPEVIRRAQLGDTAAFEWIYRIHSGRIYAVCSHMLGNWTEAEDLTQEVFLTVLRKIRSFRGKSAFSTWLHRIAVNLALMRIRKKTRLEISLEESNELDSGRNVLREELASSDLRMAGSLDRVHLQRGMDQLPPRHKLVIELHDIQGYQHKEIAQIMDCSIGNSKAQLHRARRKLREILQKSLQLRWARVRATELAFSSR
jgi:RNA polymerase sigma-70 factor, ECF subfamily